MDALLYILFSPKADKFYIGHTTEPIEVRVRKHNSDHKGYTGKFNDWKVVYQEIFSSKQLAYARVRISSLLRVIPFWPPLEPLQIETTFLFES